MSNQPTGLDTVTGPRGVKVSGGERQRLGAARCICKQPGIVILDESTSSLDSQTERKLQGTFAKLFQGRTTLIIAHRLSTIMHADEILVLAPCLDPSRSSIVERGTHDELLGMPGVYSSMWRAQTESE